MFGQKGEHVINKWDGRVDMALTLSIQLPRPPN